MGNLYTFEISAENVDGRSDKRRVFAAGILDAVLAARAERGWTEHLCHGEIVDPYRDADCAERHCERCGNTYRGPTAHCSEHCAGEGA